MKRGSLAGRVLWATAVAIGCAVVLAGCGGATSRMPELAALPMVAGAHVVSNVRVCDKGSKAYCALELVVTDPHYASSRDFVVAERDLLKARGWTADSAQTGDEFADESPGHKLRITYDTAYGDLKGIDLDWIQRTRQTQEALSGQMFVGAITMSAQLQIGSQ